MATETPTRRWALVTGASAGIGAAFARELATRGWSLMLTARREDRLQQLALELNRMDGIRADYIVSDLADPAAPQKLCAEIEHRGIGIDMLVNNAGYGVTGHYLAQPWQTHTEFLQVMVSAPCELAHLLLPRMQQQGFGRIANIASLAGIMPGPAGHTLYAASKAFLIKFSQSLALENLTRGVKVCAICPGFTFSEFHDVTGTRSVVSKMPRWMWQTADEVAHSGLDAMERGDIVYVPGRVNRTIKLLTKLLTDRAALRLVQKRSKDFRKQ
jgi:uncharacterized protein